MSFVTQLKACAYWKGQKIATTNTDSKKNILQIHPATFKQIQSPFSIWIVRKCSTCQTFIVPSNTEPITLTQQFNNKRTENSHHLLAAINAVQSLLQLSKGVALQALGSLLRDRSQRLPQQWLRGLREGLRGATGLVLWLRLHLLEKKSQRSKSSNVSLQQIVFWLLLIVRTLNVNILKLPCSGLQLPDFASAAALTFYLEAKRE